MSEDVVPKLTTTEQRKAMWESGELSQVFMKNLVSPELVEVLRKLQDSPAMKQLRNFHDSPAGKSLQLIHQSLAKYQGTLQTIPELVLPPEMIKAVRAVRNIGQSLERMQSPLVNYLASNRAPDLGRLVEASGTARVSVVATCEARVITAQELTLEREIVERLERGESPASLPQDQKSYLGWVLSLLFALILYLGQQNAVREELCFFQPKIAPILTANQTGKAIRKFLCEADMPAEMLRGYRLVDGVGVRLREGPGTKFMVVPAPLSDRAVLEVLDNSNRDWLHVSVVNEDGVEGWISRKYTHRLMR
jgi:hypothetical protein